MLDDTGCESPPAEVVSAADDDVAAAVSLRCMLEGIVGAAVAFSSDGVLRESPPADIVSTAEGDVAAADSLGCELEGIVGAAVSVSSDGVLAKLADTGFESPAAVAASSAGNDVTGVVTAASDELDVGAEGSAVYNAELLAESATIILVNVDDVVSPVCSGEALCWAKHSSQTTSSELMQQYATMPSFQRPSPVGHSESVPVLQPTLPVDEVLKSPKSQSDSLGVRPKAMYKSGSPAETENDSRHPTAQSFISISK